jgi:serine/threonine protein kinase
MSVIIENKYRIINRIGEGAYGSIFEGHNINTGEKVAIKISEMNSNILLKNEARIYNALSDVDGIPIIRSYGMTGKYSYLVMNLLGNSLEYLKEQCGGRLTLKCVLMIGVKLLERIKTIHQKGIIHRDIKPDNILFGRGEDEDKLFLIDFGMAKTYIDSRREHIDITYDNRLVGTREFVSVNIHNGYTPSRRDDLESVGYLLIYLLQGSTPWSNINIIDTEEKNKQIGGIKTMKSVWMMFDDDIPGEFVLFIMYCRKLEFSQEPDYNYLKILLTNLYKLHGFPVDNKYDWSTD